jgi:hypothetical protein
VEVGEGENVQEVHVGRGEEEVLQHGGDEVPGVEGDKGGEDVNAVYSAARKVSSCSRDGKASGRTGRAQRYDDLSHDERVLRVCDGLVEAETGGDKPASRQRESSKVSPGKETEGRRDRATKGWREGRRETNM